MFWFEFRRPDGTTYVMRSDGLTPAEREAVTALPTFVREFHGDAFGREYGRGRTS